MATAIVIVVCAIGAVSAFVKGAGGSAPERAYGIASAIMWVVFGVLGVILLS